MTIKELKELITAIPDHYEVCYEYDGPETLIDQKVNYIYISIERENVVLIHGDQS